MPASPATPAHSPCRAPGDLPPALGMQQGKMGWEDGCEAAWAAQRLQPKILPVSFITNICGVAARTLQNSRAHTAGSNCRVQCLFIYLLLLINWKWICFYTFKMCVCVIKNYSFPRAVERAIFPLEEESSMLNGGTAQPRHQVLQAASITSWPVLQLGSQCSCSRKWGASSTDVLPELPCTGLPAQCILAMSCNNLVIPVPGKRLL